MGESPSTKKQTNTLVIILLIIIIFLLCAVIGIFLFMRNSNNEYAQSVTADGDGIPKLAYATEGVTVVDDEQALQDAVAAMQEKAKEGTISLWFKNQAFSSDGKNFDCFIGNSERNSYDLFITLFADEEMTDQLFLSGLIRPGEGFEKISLERELEPGTHNVYVALTQVEEDMETIHAQTFLRIEFIVK